jgi:hypothetical protein
MVGGILHISLLLVLLLCFSLNIEAFRGPNGRSSISNRLTHRIGSKDFKIFPRSSSFQSSTSLADLLNLGNRKLIYVFKNITLSRMTIIFNSLTLHLI